MRDVFNLQGALASIKHAPRIKRAIDGVINRLISEVEKVEVRRVRALTLLADTKKKKKKTDLEEIYFQYTKRYKEGNLFPPAPTSTNANLRAAYALVQQRRRLPRIAGGLAPEVLPFLTISFNPLLLGPFFSVLSRKSGCNKLGRRCSPERLASELDDGDENGEAGSERSLVSPSHCLTHTHIGACTTVCNSPVHRLRRHHLRLAWDAASHRTRARLAIRHV